MPLDFFVRIKETDRGKWPVPDRESQSAILRWASGQAEGTGAVFRVLKTLSTRSKKQHGLYRIRLAILAAALDTDTESLHEFIKTELDLTEEVTIAGKTFTRLRSQKEATTEEMSSMLTKQDDLAAYVNTDREPQDYLILPVPEDMHERSNQSN